MMTRATRYHRLLLIVSGMGGLLYGIDVGIISGALPYLEATSGLSQAQLSVVVAAVLLGSVLSTLFAGFLADLVGRRALMAAGGVCFVISIPLIALADGYGPLVLGRILQGASGGVIGVVVPLYLAECLEPGSRGKGTGIFQWMLTLGIVAAAVIGLYYSHRVGEVAKLNDPAKLFAYQETAWRRIFWVSLPPGVFFVLGSFLVAESPRWLFRRGRQDAARRALSRALPPEQVEAELHAIKLAVQSERGDASPRQGGGTHTLLQRKYVVPFVLACVILACNQLTGISAIIGYCTTILLQSGLSDVQAHFGYLILTLVIFLGTWAAVVLVDRKGRKFLLTLGSGGIVISLAMVGFMFHRNEARRIDRFEAVQAMTTPEQSLSVSFNSRTAQTLSGTTESTGKSEGLSDPLSLVVIYSYGDFRAATKSVRSDDASAGAVEIRRASALPANKVVAFFANPFGDLAAARNAPLKIEHALIAPIPPSQNGWLTLTFLAVFMGFFSIGPGVCVWLALSELMPTRIRSNGMSIALLINQGVSTVLAGIFLPTVGRFGYAVMFLGFAACTIIYFLTALLLLPETKGKTLEEIERHFAGTGAAPRKVDEAQPELKR